MTAHGSAEADGTPPVQDRSTSRWSVLVPALALLIGLLIGGVVVGVADGGGDSPSAGPQPTESPTDSPSTVPADGGSTAFVVPDECLAAADTVEEVTALVRQGAAAIRDLQTAELRSVLRELETLDEQAREQARACRESRIEESPSNE